MSLPDDKTVENAVADLASIFDLKEKPKLIPEGKEDALFLACVYMGKFLNLNITKPTHKIKSNTVHDVLTEIAKASQFRIRRITLRGTWWKNTNDPLLLFDQKNHEPFVLIPKSKGSYEIIYPLTGNTELLTAEHIQSFSPSGYMFYRCLPDISLNVKTLVRFVLQQQKGDLFKSAYLQALAALLALLTPIGTGILLNTAVPNADISLLWQWILGLFVSLLGMTIFGAVQALLLLRFRFKANASMQAAIWDRLIRLPVYFFQKFSPGDLTMRASGIDSMQQELTDASVGALLGGVFSCFTLGLMFFYSPILALVALGLLCIMLLAMWLYAVMQLRYQRSILHLQGQLASLILQILSGIAKLRVSHSEKRVFALWVEKFSPQNRAFILSSLLGIRFSILRVLIITLGLLLIYAIVGMNTDKMSFGDFIAFNAAFGQFFGAALALGGVFTTFIGLIPLYERIQPILTTLPEQEIEGEDPGILSGEITLEDVSFHYHPESPWVLENLSLTIKPGEMVAFVGSTGCGKSTLFRLLLGFEIPSAGHVLYDHCNMSTLNIRKIREQLGVVLQNSTILPGTLFETIAGSRRITLEDAWDAVTQVNLAKDIEAMPMGMHTILAEAGKTLSVGQLQRLMIARALATKPRILFLDEATSALDNPTQHEVMNNLEKLKITRVIAAHRLSTVKRADRIYVLDEGRIIQSGKHQDLIAQEGLFAELVRRQLI